MKSKYGVADDVLAFARDHAKGRAYWSHTWKGILFFWFSAT